MLPLLAQLGITLAAGIAQKVAADKQYKEDLREHQQNVITGIMDKRAARAGDAMYMQQAINGVKHKPEKPDDGIGQLAAKVGMALLNRTEEPDKPGPERDDMDDGGGGIGTSGPSSFNVSKGSKGWAGADWKDEDRYRNIA